MKKIPAQIFLASRCMGEGRAAKLLCQLKESDSGGKSAKRTGQWRHVCNHTNAEVLWLIVGASEEMEFLPGAETRPNMSLI